MSDLSVEDLMESLKSKPKPTMIENIIKSFIEISVYTIVILIVTSMCVGLIKLLFYLLAL
jgi:hypothetical protein